MILLALLAMFAAFFAVVVLWGLFPPKQEPRLIPVSQVNRCSETERPPLK
jgi:hypothetical protein